MKQTKAMKIKEFIQLQMSAGETSPTKMRETYYQQYPNIAEADRKTLECFRVTQKRLAALKGQSAKQLRAEVYQTEIKKQLELDIWDYQQVKDYLANSDLGSVTQAQIDTQLKNIRKLWEIMGKTDPMSWTLTALLEKIEAAGYERKILDNGVKGWVHPAAVKGLLSPFATMWKGRLQPNWSQSLCIHKAGELKDYFTFEEFAEFLSKLTDNEGMSLEGWTAMFTAHVNMGCREGTEGNTGIIGLLWEDINWKTRRCSLREKGHRGHAGERWNNVPLDLFSWLHGWDALLKYWNQQGRPTKGKVFPVSYNQYNAKFHSTCHLCSSRIREDNDTIRLHIFRRTHAQYCRKLRIPLELICGSAPDGRFGVGWKDPKIPLLYYMTIEEDEFFEANQSAQRMAEKLGLSQTPK